MTKALPATLLALLASLPLLAGTPPAPAFAQEAAPAADRAADARSAGARREARPPAPENGDLPPAATTTHTVGGLAFTAVAGALKLADERGTLLAEIAHTTYRLDGIDPEHRPVIFLVNGGPGASSAWLQFGAVGPWRIDRSEAATPPSASPALRPNPETWLPFADLVFLDPAGTGYSRLVSTAEDVRRSFYSVDGDADMLAAAIRRWIEENRREVSPKFFVGESYGGFRGPLVARKLAQDHGVGLSGLVLVSPVLDFRTRDGRNPVAQAATLPSLVAAARSLDRRLGDPDDMAAVEDYAAGDYLRDLLKGPGDPETRRRLSGEVARLTGLDPAFVARHGGRIGTGTFLEEIGRRGARVASPYDATAFGLDPTPFAEGDGAPDPVLDGLRAPLTAAARELYGGRLEWAPRRRYEVLSTQVNRAWDWGRGLQMPQAVAALGQALAADPGLRVLVVHGRADLVTPYFGSRLAMNQIGIPGVEARLRLEVYPGGHMFYFDPEARARFRDAGRALVEGASAARR